MWTRHGVWHEPGMDRGMDSHLDVGVDPDNPRVALVWGEPSELCSALLGSGVWVGVQTHAVKLQE